MKKVGRKANPSPDEVTVNRRSEDRFSGKPSGPATPLPVRPWRSPHHGKGCRAGLLLPARHFRRIDILVLDGKISRIIGAANAARCVGDNAVPLLTIHAPGADRTVFFLRSHEPCPPKPVFPVAARALPYLYPDLKSRNLMAGCCSGHSIRYTLDPTIR